MMSYNNKDPSLEEARKGRRKTQVPLEARNTAGSSSKPGMAGSAKLLQKVAKNSKKAFYRKAFLVSER